MRVLAALLLVSSLLGQPLALAAAVPAAVEDDCCAASCQAPPHGTDERAPEPCPDDCRLRPCCSPAPSLAPAPSASPGVAFRLEPLNPERAPAAPAVPSRDVFHPPRTP